MDIIGDGGTEVQIGDFLHGIARGLPHKNTGQQGALVATKWLVAHFTAR